MTAQSNAPVIIKRKKVVKGGGHHGGAWKVAYADFVTAMMAFFMLMWLLGATNEKQRKGIADYFNPTIPVVRASGGGSGAFGGDSVFSELSLSRTGTGGGQVVPTEERQARGETGVSESDAPVNPAEDDAAAAELEEIASRLSAHGGESMVTELLQRHVITRLSDEGLVIELFDTDEAKLFDESGQPTVLLNTLTTAIVPVIEVAQNPLAVEAHASATPIVALTNRSWEVTTDRARNVRTLLEDAGFTPERIRRLTGHADRRPAVRNPMAPRNDRIEIILLRDRL